MHSSKADEGNPSGWGLEELGLLAALGFGPDSLLMNEPKLFVDAPFLAALQVELTEELGERGARGAFFQVGMIHGLRDAIRIRNAPASDARTSVACPPLAMRFGIDRTEDGSLVMPGTWPDAYEAEARLAKLGCADAPACALSTGYTSGWLSGTLEIDVLALESSCTAADADHCTFVAREADAWRECGDARATELMGGLSFASLRAVAAGLGSSTGALESAPVDTLPDHFDPEDPAVHVWGPVMVMPFTGVETTLETVETLGRDPSMREVRVVVLDLCGAEIDEGFGAAGLERLIDEIVSWGAEVILTEVSPLSEVVVAELQANLLLSRKDLPEAIAYAFQIADAQRYLL